LKRVLSTSPERDASRTQAVESRTGDSPAFEPHQIPNFAILALCPDHEHRRSPQPLRTA